MRTLRTFFVVTAFVSTVALTTANSAISREKRCRALPACNQPTAAASTPIASQPETPVQTCCQPTVASVQPKIELVAYARPASPRRLTPRPDALETSRTESSVSCAQFLNFDFGNCFVYIAVRCEDTWPLCIFTSQVLAPVPDDCGNPGGGCLTTSNSAFIPTAFNNNLSSKSDSLIQKDVRLNRKLKAGHEPPNRADAQATGAHRLRERTRVGEPTYVKFAAPTGDSVIVELQKYFVRGTGKPSQEISTTIAIGVEVDAVPNGVKAKEMSRQEIQVTADHVAHVAIGNTTYNIVTATKLVP